MGLNVAPPLKRRDGVDDGLDRQGKRAARTAVHFAASARQAPPVKFARARTIRGLLKNKGAIKASTRALERKE